MPRSVRWKLFALVVIVAGKSVPAWAGSLSLSWDANTDATLTGYRLYYTTNSFRSPSNTWYTLAEVKANPLVHTLDVTAPLVSTRVANLTDGKTYYFRLTAYDRAAQESPFNLDSSGLDTQVSRVPSATGDTTAPTVPTGLSAVATSSTTINLTWTASTDNVGVTGYNVYRCQGAGCTPSSTRVGTSVGTSYASTGLTPSTAYVFKVSAYDAVPNTSIASSTATATTNAAPPPGLSAITATGITSSSATITWTTTEASDTQVEYGLTTAYGTSSPLNTALVTAHSQGLTGLNAATLYHYRVKSKGAWNNLATSTDKTFTTGDSEDPTVTLTAPGSGARVSGTVVVRASASDNVGVVGVRFKLDGVNLMQEDTASPYMISWDTTGVSLGNHTLTAVARDGAGNTTVSTGLVVTVVAFSEGENAPPKVFPNPLKLGTGKPMVFTHCGASRSLKIYSMEGVKVAELTTDTEGRAVWDGIDRGGTLVSSGVYWVKINGEKLRIIVQR